MVVKNGWLAELVKEERKKLGLIQKDLARQVGINVNTLGAIEKGSRGVSIKTVEKLLSELGWELDAYPYDIVGGGDYKNRSRR